MEYVIYILATFVFALLEPLLFNLLGISLFFVVSNIALEKKRDIGILVIAVVVSLLLDTVFKYPLGVYLISLCVAEIAGYILSLFLNRDIFLQSLLGKIICSILFYLVLYFSINLDFSIFISLIMVKVLVAGILSGILITFFDQLLRDSKNKGSFLKFKK